MIAILALTAAILGGVAGGLLVLWAIHDVDALPQPVEVIGMPEEPDELVAEVLARLEAP